MLNSLLVLLCACMPVAIISSDVLPSPLFYLALAVALCIIVRRSGSRMSAGQVLTDYRVLLYCYAVPLFAVLLSSTVHGRWAGAAVESGLRIAFGLPILVLGLRWVKPSLLRQSIWGIYVAALVATGYVVYLTYPSLLVRPVTTVYNAVSYGNIMLLLAMISLYSLRWRLTQFHKLESIFKVIVVAATLVGFVLTQTRTGWLAVPVFAALGVALVSGFRRPWRAAALLAVILVLAVALGSCSPSLRGRVENGYRQATQCYGSDQPVDSSVCVRFQLWRAAWHAFQHNPAFGLGDHSLFPNWMETRALPDGVVSTYVASNFGEPHNDMMQALSSFGVLGGVGLLLLYLAPAWLFLRRMGSRYSNEIRVAAAMGAATCLGFAVFGITELMFRGMRTVGFYVMLVAIFLVLSEPAGYGEVDA
jgi:O-antigen ligase